MDNAILAYWQQIEDGTVTVGKWIRALYGMMVDRIESGQYIYSQKKADRAIRFIEAFAHHHVLAANLSQHKSIFQFHINRLYIAKTYLLMGRKCHQSLEARCRQGAYKSRLCPFRLTTCVARALTSLRLQCSTPTILPSPISTTCSPSMLITR
jgi:hypothetical protein